MKKDIKYYFALGALLKDLKLSQAEARRRYGFSRKGRRYISKTNLHLLCSGRTSPRDKTLNIICNAMGVTPGDLWRVEAQ